MFASRFCFTLLVETLLLVFSVPCASCLPRRLRLSVDALPLALTVLGHPRIERSTRKARAASAAQRQSDGKQREPKASCPPSPQLLSSSALLFPRPSQRHIRCPWTPRSQVRERDDCSARAGVCPLRICDRIFRSLFPSIMRKLMITGMLCPQRKGSPLPKTQPPANLQPRYILDEAALAAACCVESLGQNCLGEVTHQWPMPIKMPTLFSNF